MTHTRNRHLAGAVLALALIVAAVPVAAFPSQTALAAQPEVYINEIQVSTSGIDWEFVELWGTPGDNFSNVTLIGVESDVDASAGRIDLVIGLQGQSIPTDGFWLAISPAGASTYGVTGELSIADSSFENSSATYFLVSGFNGKEGDDLDTDDDGVLDATPWHSVIDAINLRDDEEDFDYGVTSVGPDGNYLPSGTYRCPDAPDGTFGSLHIFDTPNGTPGASNTQCSGACGDPATLISEVQGEGSSSPLEGEQVVIEGIVVGDFQWGDDDDGDLGGFYVQEEDNEADGNPLTSEGVFVYDSGFGVDVAVGERVRVNGFVSEYYGLTQMESLSNVLVCSGGGKTTPAEVTLPVTSVDDLEAYEGMSIVMSQPLVVSEFYNFDRYGETVLTTDRQFQPTAIYDPDSPEAAALAEENELSRIQLEDGRTASNPDPALHPNGLEFDLTNRFRGGDIVQDVTGVMSYGFGEYEIQPTAGADYAPENLRPPAPDDVGGDITTASFNVLNYFTTLDTGEEICGPTGGQDCRGANDATEFERQQAKIVAAMCGIDADIFGLMELENTNPDNDPDPDDGISNYVLKSLVDALNAEDSPCPDKTYAFTDSEAVGTDAIQQSIIYKASTVTPLGRAVLDDPAFTDPNDLGEQKNRPAIAETFTDNETGGVFTAVVNHLKSKGSSCGDGDDHPLAGSCNLTRALAAQELADWLDTDPTGSGDPDFLILGDLNSYDNEDPIDVLVDNGYIDLLLQYEGEEAYTYVFDGQLGYLDYGMPNEALLAQVTGATAWHINADEPDILNYDTTYKEDAQDALYEVNPFRSSDHDPVIVGLTLTPEDQGPEEYKVYLLLIARSYSN